MLAPSVTLANTPSLATHLDVLEVVAEEHIRGRDKEPFIDSDKTAELLKSIGGPARLGEDGIPEVWEEQREGNSNLGRLKRDLHYLVPR